MLRATEKTLYAAMLGMVLVEACAASHEKDRSKDGGSDTGEATGSSEGYAGEGREGGFADSGGTGVSGGTDGSVPIDSTDGSIDTGGASGRGITYGITKQSCEGSGEDCRDNGTAVNCCESKLVRGGSFPMGRCSPTRAGCSDEYDGLIAEVPEHEATVNDFYLDTFEVTVGRFRKFVEVYDGTAPGQDAGAHPLIADSGWHSAWDEMLPLTKAALIDGLKCSGNIIWTDEVGAKEQYPINCVNWYEAFAFCIWDGGRLPTEAEWEYAAAGGAENRLYPWGSEPPDSTPERANIGTPPPVDVGSYPDGVARWGQHDLAGSMSEFVLDGYDCEWYSEDGNTCNNCANLNGLARRVIRGGSWDSSPISLRAAYRSPFLPMSRNSYIGLRCARDP